MTSAGSGRKSAVVVGAGIGGLTAAAALSSLGWAVTVLERAPAIAEVGAGLTLWPNAVRALDELGLGEIVSAHAVPTISRGNIRRPDGRWLRRSRPGDVGVLAVHRAELHDLLRRAIPESALHTGTEVLGVTDSADQATIEYVESGGTHDETFDLVVGADGINSVTRRQLWPDHPQPVFQRRSVWRGITDPDSSWPVQEFLTLGRAEQVGVLPLPNHRVYWFLTVNADAPGRRHENERAEVLRRIGDWHDPIPSLVEATRPERVLHNDIVDLDPLPSYARRHTALLGDAAHAMTPDLGQGACQAIEDAVVLAAELSRTDDIPAALASYDGTRRARTQMVARASRRNAVRNADDRLVTQKLTSLAVRFMPSGLWRRSTARWATWAPPEIDVRIDPRSGRGVRRTSGPFR
jgi:2-polyprenyl-6-methoxyphenol hydroxylase-like FAD-dependent oxidoreductase